VNQISNSSERGLFIAFEGGDGAGKSTQLSLLSQFLAATGAQVVTTREPGGTEIGEKLRSLVLEHGHGQIDSRTEALMYAAARAAHVEQFIRPQLALGTHVISDRFVDSSLAYQGVGRGLGVQKVGSINSFAIDGLAPDLTILLDISAVDGRERRTARNGSTDEEDRIESEPDEFHERIRQAFLTLARSLPKNYLVLDATNDAEDLHKQVISRLQAVL
jgi:dTMP kinase